MAEEVSILCTKKTTQISTNIYDNCNFSFRTKVNLKKHDQNSLGY